MTVCDRVKLSHAQVNLTAEKLHSLASPGDTRYPEEEAFQRLVNLQPPLWAADPNCHIGMLCCRFTVARRTATSTGNALWDEAKLSWTHPATVLMAQQASSVVKAAACSLGAAAAAADAAGALASNAVYFGADSAAAEAGGIAAAIGAITGLDLEAARIASVAVFAALPAIRAALREASLRADESRHSVQHDASEKQRDEEPERTCAEAMGAALACAQQAGAPVALRTCSHAPSALAAVVAAATGADSAVVVQAAAAVNHPGNAGPRQSVAAADAASCGDACAASAAAGASTAAAGTYGACASGGHVVPAQRNHASVRAVREPVLPGEPAAVRRADQAASRAAAAAAEERGAAASNEAASAARVADTAAKPVPPEQTSFTLLRWFHRFGLSGIADLADQDVPGKLSVLADVRYKNLRNADCMAVEAGADRLVWARADEDEAPAAVRGAIAAAATCARPAALSKLAKCTVDTEVPRTRHMAHDLLQAGAYCDLQTDEAALSPVEVLPAVLSQVRIGATGTAAKQAAGRQKGEGQLTQREILQECDQFRVMTTGENGCAQGDRQHIYSIPHQPACGSGGSVSRASVM